MTEYCKNNSIHFSDLRKLDVLQDIIKCEITEQIYLQNVVFTENILNQNIFKKL